MSDRQDEQRPATEDDGAATPPWSAEPVRHTDGQRWEASVESWSTPAPQQDGDGDGQRPSWEVPQQPAEDGGTGSTAVGAGAPAPSWQQPSWAAPQAPWAPQPSWAAPAGAPEQAAPQAPQQIGRAHV